MNVLSLCDGMSCGYMAFKKAGISVDKYYASEIKREEGMMKVDERPISKWLADLLGDCL